MAGWKRFFVTAAAFNVVVGATFLVAAPDALALLGFAEPPDVLFHRLTGLLVLCFGAVFFVVSRAPERYRALVLIAAIGKLGSWPWPPTPGRPARYPIPHSSSLWAISCTPRDS